MLLLVTLLRCLEGGEPSANHWRLVVLVLSLAFCVPLLLVPAYPVLALLLLSGVVLVSQPPDESQLIVDAASTNRDGKRECGSRLKIQAVRGGAHMGVVHSHKGIRQRACALDRLCLDDVRFEAIQLPQNVAVVVDSGGVSRPDV